MFLLFKLSITGDKGSIEGNLNTIYVKIKYSITLESFKENTILVAFDSIT